MSPEHGSGKGGNGAGGGFGGHLERSDGGRMSLLDEEDYGMQPRVLMVRVYYVCFFPVCFLFSSYFFSLPPSILSSLYAISDVFQFSKIFL